MVARIGDEQFSTFRRDADVDARKLALRDLLLNQECRQEGNAQSRHRGIAHDDPVIDPERRARTNDRRVPVDVEAPVGLTIGIENGAMLDEIGDR